MKTARTKNKVLAVLFVLLATTAYGQDAILDLQGVGDKTIIRNHGTSQAVVCHRPDSDPDFYIAEDGSSNTKVILYYSDSIAKVTDFYAYDSVIYMCGKLSYNSSWFVGDVCFIGTGDTWEDYVILPNVSNLAKVGQLYNLFNAGIVTAGNDNNGNGILIETYFNGSSFKTHTLPLTDSANTKYTIDDMIVLDNYIVVSGHYNTSVATLAKKGIVWYIENPASTSFPISHINSSNVYFQKTLYKTKNKLYLAKKDGTNYYLAGTYLLNRLP